MTNHLHPEVPRSGQFTIVTDNSPFSLEGRHFSYQQIMLALHNGAFRPGMKFRHAKAHQEFVLTTGGLLPHKNSKN